MIFGGLKVVPRQQGVNARELGLVFGRWYFVDGLGDFGFEKGESLILYGVKMECDIAGVEKWLGKINR